MDTVHIHRPAGPKISLSCFRFRDPGTVLAYFREGRDKKTETAMQHRDTFYREEYSGTRFTGYVR